jgi:hypothetical protein
MTNYINTINDLAEERARDIASGYLNDLIKTPDQSAVCRLLKRCLDEALRVEPALLPGTAAGLSASFTPVIEAGLAAMLRTSPELRTGEEEN